LNTKSDTNPGAILDIVPNLHFNGDCEKAMTLYEQAFGAQRIMLLRYRDAAPQDADDEIRSGSPEAVYHAEMIIGGRRVMLTDHIESIPQGINLSLLVTFKDIGALKKAYTVMKTGARILIPLTETTYSSGFASLVDRYGIRWELMKEN
jgi:PhnB protein